MLHARDHALSYFEKSGLTYKVITHKNISRLRNILDSHMKLSGAFRGTLQCDADFTVDPTLYARITCSSDYFTEREVVTFNDDGFIGLAGWADPKNIIPVAAAFCEWVDEMATEMASGGEVEAFEDIITADDFSNRLQRDLREFIEDWKSQNAITPRDYPMNLDEAHWYDAFLSHLSSKGETVHE